MFFIIFNVNFRNERITNKSYFFLPMYKAFDLENLSEDMIIDYHLIVCNHITQLTEEKYSFQS